MGKSCYTEEKFMSKMELTIKRTVYDYIEKNAEKFLIKEQNQWYIVEWIIFASSGGTMLGYEMENPYTEIVGADYDKIPET